MVSRIPVLAPSTVASRVTVARLAHDAEAVLRLLRRSPAEVPRGPAVLRDLPLAFGELLTGIETAGGDTWLRETDALRLGRVVAAGIHLRCQAGFAERYEAGGSPSVETLDRLLLTAEREHRIALLASRSAARRGDVGALQELLEEVVAEGHGALVTLCRSIGSLSAAERGTGARGLRVSRLARRTALLGAATVWLGRRLLGDSRRSGTARIAENRSSLVRADPRLRMATSRLTGIAEGERTAAKGRVEEVGWIERPDIPYSRATLVGADFEIRVHRKNLSRLGIAPGAWLWTHGKVESSEGRPVLVAEFEGSGQHAGDVWEDWLADGVRGAYDLYPGVVFAEWEFPGPDRIGVEADLRSRIESPVQAEG